MLSNIGSTNVIYSLNQIYDEIRETVSPLNAPNSLRPDTHAILLTTKKINRKITKLCNVQREKQLEVISVYGFSFRADT